MSKDWLEKIQIENLNEEQKLLAETIGLEAYKKLVKSYEGMLVYVPKAENLIKNVRDEQIREEFNGTNYRELALKYGLTETWIRSIVSEKTKEIKRQQMNGQISIFDILS